ncbi:acetyl/propionyl/methylcrotonyl-CoA carboxylase subunit alpha [Pseudoxanthomonas sp.]|uniref:acetyl/propionyl/methylcrotonyl-CoA carboxylase subunit alpha n=1 Tax=Pseudoxanthomonas sp. TaxID=1871049 RepID=UPI00262EADD7|nr:acetyl/propionyl/methylcrotonyl-CoA carboxylase subunit alpha [Pseudoxanthomonas sp.]WDS35908.1 MAG: acetyl/propionyl/methylcrotonyl-CoA carboxylase subunit alpha [Pseudoxanthomonas sp.]
MNVFDKILIANRGEIACRIIATCRCLGIATVAVYSEADANARHVRLADEAVCIGPPASRDSYLRADKVIAAAVQAGAQAVHPGYGFLSENAGFARACAEAGLVFIGPPAAAIEAMGSKSAAKALMQAAGVPLVPGYHGDDQSPTLLRNEATRIGYPVLIKASAGGGGKGMRVVEREADFESALASCQREASASFGDDRVLVEKYLVRPRHIEVQVFGDSHGNVVHLYERDCSAQRRHQKVIEEAPAPGISAAFRAAIGTAAVDAARAVGYVGAGTVEFIVDADGAFYFMEMNTRLQVEHPVTELVTGQDLVAWQLRVAAGAPLPLLQDAIPLAGHAIEVRLYAEQPEKGFLPSTGTLKYLQFPAALRHMRVDSGVEAGDVISPYYDPMIAKLIVWDETREAAIARMLQALAGTRIVGVGNNVAFLSRLVAHPEVRAGGYDTGLIERALPQLVAADAALPADALAIAALWTLHHETQAATARARSSADPHSPWGTADGWRINGAATRQLELRDASGTSHMLALHHDGAGGFVLDGAPARVLSVEGAVLRHQLGTRQGHATVLADADGALHVFASAGHAVLQPVDPLAHVASGGDAHGGLAAPMPGRIIAVLAADGAQVDAGTPLLVMEAMKMEYTVSAPTAGTVSRMLCKVGDLVADKAPLVEFEATT